MWSFIFEIMVFAGLAGAIMLALRALPRVSNEVFMESRSRMRTHELMLFVERADEVLKSHFEKLLRKAKIVILKADNAVTEKIAKVTDTRTKEKTSFVIPSAEPEELSRPAITEEGKKDLGVVKETKESELVSIGLVRRGRKLKSKAKPALESNEVELVSISGGEAEEDAPPMEIKVVSKKVTSKSSTGAKRPRRKKILPILPTEL